jgi:hypothetical protein
MLNIRKNGILCQAKRLQDMQDMKDMKESFAKF